MNRRGTPSTLICIHKSDKGDNLDRYSNLRLIEYYLLNDPTKQLKDILDVKAESATSHSYQATDTNKHKLSAYILNGFKKYNVKWFGYDGTPYEAKVSCTV
ncbi:hypothetical protein EfmAA242_19560 [Enterococcus faecium]|nr:hypothetical protein EfmAA242_19560 [Enterococcus faecium]